MLGLELETLRKTIRIIESTIDLRLRDFFADVGRAVQNISEAKKSISYCSTVTVHLHFSLSSSINENYLWLQAAHFLLFLKINFQRSVS